MQLSENNHDRAATEYSIFHAQFLTNWLPVVALPAAGEGTDRI